MAAQAAADVNPHPTTPTAAVTPQPVGSPGGRALGDVIRGPFDVETPTADIRCLGVAYQGGSYWVTGADSDNILVPGQKIYQYDLSGNLLTTTLQTTGSTFWGHRDMADDEFSGGTRLFAGNESGELNVYDMSSGLPMWTNAVAVGTTQTIRGLALQPGGNFFSGDFGASILEFDLAGTVVNTYINPGTAVYGAAWNTTDNTLWLYGQDDNGFGNLCHFSEYTVGGGVLTFNNREFWMQTTTNTGIAGGADFYADALNPDVDTIVGLSQDAPDQIVASNAIGSTPPPPPVTWIVNLPGSFLTHPGGTLSEGFEGYGGTVPAHMAVSEFDASFMPSPDAWCNIGQNGPTTGGASGNLPRTGTYCLEMGGNPGSPTGIEVRNALVIGLDGNGLDLLMDFWAYDHGEETDAFDGVWVSDNGTDWFSVWGTWNDLTPATWEQVIGLDLAATPAVTSGQFYLMLAQDDNFPLGNLDGVQVDDIDLTGPPLGPTLSIANLVGGQVPTATVVNATPGDMVFFAYSFLGPGPTTLAAGVCGTVDADLGDGTPASVMNNGMVVADPGGTAVFMPANVINPVLTGTTVWLQGYDRGSCTKTNLLVEVIG